MKLNVVLHLGRSAQEVLKALITIAEETKHMSQALDALTAQVNTNADAVSSILMLVQGLAAQIETLKNDPAQLQALADSLRASDDAIAAAIAANTPAAPVMTAKKK